MGKIADWFGSWRLLSWRTALVVAFVLYTLIGFFGVPWIAEKVMVGVADKRLGRELTVETIECNPFALSLTIEGFSLPDRPGSVLLSFDRMYANLQASSLFRWALTLKQFQVEGSYIGVRRFEDQAINILEVIDDFKSRSEPSDEDGGLPRAVFHEIQISRGQLEVEDLAQAEPKLWQWGPIEILLHDISTLPEAEGDKELTIGLPTGGLLRIAGTLVVEPFGLDGSVALDGGSLENLWSAINEKFALDLTGGAVDLKLSYSIAMQEDGLHLQVSDMGVEISDLGIVERESKTELLHADSVVVSAVSASWPEQQVEAEAIVVDGASAFVWIRDDGTPSWEAWVPEPTRGEIVEAYEYVEERVDIDAKLGRFEVRNASAAFEDRTFSESARLEVADAALVVTDISSQPGSEWGLEASAAIAGESLASAKGKFSAVPLVLDAEVGLDGLELARFQAYVAKMAPLDLRAGLLSTSGQARVAPGEESSKITFAGELSVTGLDLNETVTGGTLLGWGDLNVAGIQAALAPTSLEVEKVDIFSAGLEIAVAEDGTINLLEFFKALGEEESPAAEAAAEGDPEGGLPPAHIASLEFHDCYGRYTDATTVEPFERKIESVNGTINKIATDSTTAAELTIDAAVDSGGAIHVAGQLDPFDYQRLTDIDLDVKDSHLPPLSPLSIKMIGFPIETGRATVDGSYDITDQQLASTNHIEIDNLTLGEKVEGEGKIKLPVKLGVSLLKDKEGKITLDIPVEGDLGNPEFVVVSALQAALTDLVGEIAKSPFRALARLGGGSDEQNLEMVDFAAGSADLEAAAINNLDTLAKALDQRPNLSLEIAGAVDPQADAMALSGEPPTDDSGDEDAAAELSEGEVPAVTVDSAEVQALGPARAEAIRAYLVDQAGVDGSRVTVLPETAQAEDSGDRVSCKLSVK